MKRLYKIPLVFFCIFATLSNPHFHMRKIIIATIFILFSINGMHAQHFIQNADYRKQVQQDFLLRVETFNARTEPLLSVFEDESTTQEETEALQFLYAYMPLSDLADYDGSFFLKQVRLSLAARDEFPWGKTIPEEIFRHFVLVYRVNNENLDNAREVFFNELRPRLKGLSMYDAALEVNHWCHEKAAYRASDGRTSSPLATVRTALGRCGEESTFTVTALRAVGIPARQCYTPRWAHTDDNHAWVEVWVDGKWYFLGACEPDPELNMGWFAIPSTRTMMVHSNAFGKYNGTEEVTHKTDLFSRVNMLPNYTDTKKITITVTDENGKAVEGAKVKFKLYNYSEYYPIAAQKTDGNGTAQVTTGLGDLLIWACKDGKYGYQLMDIRKTDQLTVKLNRTAGAEYAEDLTVVPPVGKHDVVTATPEKAAANARRLQYEDSVRNAYIATFKTEKDASDIQNDNLTQEQIGRFLKKCEGNYSEMIKLLDFNREKRDGLFLFEFINSLSDKDLRDFNAVIIQKHITTYNAKKYPLDVYLKGTISPRIANEGIRAWRNPLRKNMLSELKGEKTSDAVMGWIRENIVIDNEGNYFNCPISPMGVYELRRADRHSRDIFFVACCRALDIPAYMDNATGDLWVWDGNKWQLVTFDEKKAAPATGQLTIDYQGNGELKPKYWTNFSIARFEDGDFVTFDYEDDPRVENFPFTLTLEAGYYLLSTGNRYSDGTALSHLEFFNIEPNQEVKKQLVIRDLVKRTENYGKIRTDYKINVNGKKIPVSELMKGQQGLVCFIDPTREPTKHLLKELGALRNDFEKWGRPVIFAIPEGKVAPDFNFKAWNLPKQSLLIQDKGNQWFKDILSSADLNFRDDYPVVFLINPDGTIVFKSEGYRIGTGELILKSIDF